MLSPTSDIKHLPLEKQQEYMKMKEQLRKRMEKQVSNELTVRGCIISQSSLVRLSHQLKPICCGNRRDYMSMVVANRRGYVAFFRLIVGKSSNYKTYLTAVYRLTAQQIPIILHDSLLSLIPSVYSFYHFQVGIRITKIQYYYILS